MVSTIKTVYLLLIGSEVSSGFWGPFRLGVRYPFLFTCNRKGPPDILRLMNKNVFVTLSTKDVKHFPL